MIKVFQSQNISHFTSISVVSFYTSFLFPSFLLSSLPPSLLPSFLPSFLACFFISSFSSLLSSFLLSVLPSFFLLSCLPFLFTFVSQFLCCSYLPKARHLNTAKPSYFIWLPRSMPVCPLRVLLHLSSFHWRHWSHLWMPNELFPSESPCVW